MFMWACCKKQVDLKTNHVSSCAVKYQQRAMLPKVRAAHAVIPSVILGSTLQSDSEEQHDVYKLYRCFLPATLNRPVRVDMCTWREKESTFYQYLIPESIWTGSHLMLYCVSPQMANKHENRILVKKTLRMMQKCFLCPTSLAKINVRIYSRNKCIYTSSLPQQCGENCPASQTTPGLTDE